MAYNVFLSFAMEDKQVVDLFRGQAKNDRLPLEFRDHSIKEPFEKAWKTQCREKIRRCSVTVCLVGRDTYKSEAVDWEIRESDELGKAVMAIDVGPGTPRLPEALKDLGVQPVRWNMTEIMAEIRRLVG